MEELPIKLELRKLGLTDKEVTVYLVGLELGPNSVLNIAKRANITRPTTYEIINRLKKKGLFYEIIEGRKRYFVAQSPDKILGLLRMQKREIEEKEREFIRIIAALESKYSKEKGEIKIFKGEEGINLLLEENLSFTPLPKVFVLSSDKDLKEIKKREDIYKVIKRRLGKIEVKEIYTEEAEIKSKKSQIQRKFSSEIKIKGTLILSDNAIYIYPTKQEGLLVENQLIVGLLKSLFSTLWQLI